MKVNQFSYPVDFIVMDTEPTGDPQESQTPVILGRPFLATANARINCHSGEMKLACGNQRLKLNVFHQGENINEIADHSGLDWADISREDALPAILTKDPLNLCLNKVDVDAVDIDGSTAEMKVHLNLGYVGKYLPWHL